eukprot:scaffold49534_cov15-Tisochrysis_lutea.AAC.1
MSNCTAVVLGGDLYVERRSKMPPQIPVALAGVAGTLAVGLHFLFVTGKPRRSRDDHRADHSRGAACVPRQADS